MLTKTVKNILPICVSPPKLEDWGMIVPYLVDPTGVLWHITQTRSRNDEWQGANNAH